MGKKIYNSVDLAKLVASFLIVAIHTNIFISFSEVFNWYFVNLFCRIAVYFFFIASSYFFFSKLTYDKGKIEKSKDNLSKLKIYVLRMTILYLIWTAVYFIYDLFYWYQIDCLTFGNLLGYFIMIVRDSSHYHLWFLISLIYAIPIMYFVLCFINKRMLFVISMVFYVFGLVFGSYYFFSTPFDSFWQLFGSLWVRLRTVLFDVIPICALSFAVDFIRIKRPALILMTIVCFLLYSFEGMLLYNINKDNASSFNIFLLPTVLFVFALVKGKNIMLKHGFIIRKLSTIIYCIHPLHTALKLSASAGEIEQ